jgi:hypothetical protein
MRRSIGPTDEIVGGWIFLWLDLLPDEIVGGWIFFAPLDWSYRRNCGWLDLLPAEIVGGWIFFCGWLDLLIFQVGAWIFLAVPISP